MNSSITLQGDGSGNLTFNNNQSFSLNASNLTIANNNTGGASIVMQGNITGTGGILKTGNGLLSLSSNSSSFTGAVAVDQGILAVSHPGALVNTPSVTVNGTGQLRVDAGGALTFGAGAGTTINLAGVGDGNGSLRISSAVVDAARTLSNSINLTADATLGIQGAGNSLSFSATSPAPACSPVPALTPEISRSRAPTTLPSD